jgi:uncharacterized iron-regulated protein
MAMRLGFIVLSVLTAASTLSADPSGQFLFDLRKSRGLTLAEALPEILKSRIVLVGEQHSDIGHHRAQLKVIQSLVQAGARVAIGLEMFRKDSQQALDRWTAGDISLLEFEKIFNDNWGYPWAAYSPIFEFARAHRLKMIGLNVPRDITRQVAHKGFQSLTEEQRGRLPDISCSIDEEYMRYIRGVYGAHPHSSMNFTFFCEAQMVWDAAMAAHALDFFKTDPEATVVILTGVGHALKGAVPRQISLRAQVPVTVLLPEVPDRIDPRTADAQDADYLLRDVK